MLRILAAAAFVATGVLHFLRPAMYEAIVPEALPAHRELVLISGAAEIAGGVGLLHPATRRPAGWGLIALLVAVFPANVNMAVNAERFSMAPAWVWWARLPLQAVLIVWVRAAMRR